ncbi:DUF4350 domain-containing protein [Halorubellus litoreus]|uniref:DUF4350 domain-containing protein n=1 Tax=Halorubellus litoreus TaxID=755308 RepID=A0ABD5VJI9_9EURY
MRVELPQYVLAFVVLVAVAGVVYAGSTSTAAFGGYNPAWDGSEDARVLAAEHGETTVVRDAEAYESLSSNATAVVLSPVSEYDQASLSAVRAFVERGGTLVVAGDFGGGANALLSGVGAEARIDGRLLRDERRYGATPAMPLATNVTNSTYTRGVDRLALNYPSVVNATDDVRVLARSSSFSYLDVNRNDALDDAETLGARPVVTAESVGDGTVVVVSDPSLFINTMLDRQDNRAFVVALADDGPVAFDYSHAGGVPPLAVLVLVLEESALAQLAVGAVLVALAAALLEGVSPLAALAAALLEGVSPLAALEDRLGRERPRTPLRDDDVRAFIRDRHPDWDADRVERLAQSINRRSQNDEGER